MRERRTRRPQGPCPSVPDPRRRLLEAVLAFARAAQSVPGILRIALLGSLTTGKPIPKDADVLVTIERDMDLSALARIGRPSQAHALCVNNPLVTSR